MSHELLSRDHEDGRATGPPQGVDPEAYLNGTSQGPTPEDARKDGHIRGRSKRFMRHPGSQSDFLKPVQFYVLPDFTRIVNASVKGNVDTGRQDLYSSHRGTDIEGSIAEL